MPWGDRAVDRHRGFSTVDELLAYLQQRGPHSCFHSTAYYHSPSERVMNDKGWKGADLIFDLDGDHLPGVSDTDFPAMIEKIQEQAWALWSGFLEPEFGMDAANAQFSFSGHRGFHIHIRDSELMTLDSNARREIVSYIRGEGLDISAVLSAKSSGWQNRIEVGTESVLNKLNIINSRTKDSNLLLNEFHDILNDKSAGAWKKSKSVGKKRIQSLAEMAGNKERIERIQGDHKLQVFGKDTPLFWELVKGDESVVLGTAGETDENVTVDIKRVIRWIGSLHGKCGLRVTEIPFERLDPDGSNPFDPLSEAIALGGGIDARVSLLRDDVTARIGTVEINGSTGDVFTVNDSMATFLCLKGWASIISE